MKLSAPLRNYYRFIQLLDQVELPGGVQLIGNLNDNDELTVCFKDSPIEAILTVIESSAFNITVLEHHRGWANESIIPVPTGELTDDQLKDVLRELIEVIRP